MGELIDRRLHNQHIGRGEFESPAEVVRWLGAVQAQDFAGAKWAIGLRMRTATDAMVGAAFDRGEILRTHLLRPTWHFVTPEDIGWMLELTAPRVHQANGTWYRRLGLDAARVRRSQAALTKALRGGRHRTRDELRQILQAAGIPTEGSQRLVYTLMRAELDGLICSGPRRGRQFTYALLEERAPQARSLDRGRALAELARRYFVSRGPASVHDFARWSGLMVADARRGLEAVRPQLEAERLDDRELWSPPDRPAARKKALTAHLLSVYDEYISGYRDRGEIVEPEHARQLQALGNDLTAVVLIGGRIAGTWKRELGRQVVKVQTSPLHAWSTHHDHAVAKAARRYAGFLELPLVLTWPDGRSTKLLPVR